MFAKVFSTLWQGSMVGKADAQLVFIFLLAHCDRDGMVEVTQEHVSALTGIPLDRVMEAIALLESPDPRSRSRELEGRRLTRQDPSRDWGWQVVNHAHYRALRDEEQRREANRARMRTVRTSAPPCAEVRPGVPIADSREQSLTASSLRSDAATGPDAAEQLALDGRQATVQAKPKLPGIDWREVRNATADDIVGLWLPTNTGSYWIAGKTLINTWTEAFPAVNVPAEFARMRSWLAGHKSRAKTARGMGAFVHNWLSGEQDKGGRGKAGRGVRAGADADYMDANKIGGGAH